MHVLERRQVGGGAVVEGALEQQREAGHHLLPTPDQAQLQWHGLLLGGFQGGGNVRVSSPLGWAA